MSEESKVNKKGFLEIDGKVTELLPNTTFKVALNNGQEILAHLSGKMRRYKIRILPDDKITLEISPHDMTKGRIIFRK